MKEFEKYEMSDLILLKTKLCSNSMLFTDLDRIPGFKAKNHEDAHGLPCNKEYPNLVAWDWVTKKGIETLTNLRILKLLDCWGCSPMLYYFEGARLDIPLAKSVRNYKKPRWFPMAFGLTKKGEKYYQKNDLFSIRRELHEKRIMF